MALLEETQATPIAEGTPVVELSSHGESNEEWNHPHFRNRMLLCLLAMGFNWGTSLRVANYFASSVIKVPPLDAVFQTCQHAYNITRDERVRYTQCVESQLNQCNGRLDRSKETEDQRVRMVSMNNAEVVQRAEEIATKCSESYTTLRLSLEDWTANGGIIPIQSNDGMPSNTESGCSPEDQDAFDQTMLGTQNIVAIQTEAMAISNTYESESTLTVVRLAKYAKERAEYDATYVDQRTQALQNSIFNAVDSVKVPSVEIEDLFEEIHLATVDMLACISLDKNARMRDGSVCDPNMATTVRDFYNDAVWKVAMLRASLYEFRDKVNEYKGNVMRAYAIAKRFYNGT